jgi:hypothetical protein
MRDWTRVIGGLLGIGLCAAGAFGDPILDILAQTSLAEYQSYARILSGVDAVPGNPPVYLENRYALINHGGDVAATWLYDRLSSFGLDVNYHGFSGLYSSNVVAEKYGTERPNDIYILCAHYDSYAEPDPLHAPGCDDNGSGTAALLMAARVLSQYQFEGTLRFVAFSAEEESLVGSHYYARLSSLYGENIVGVINVDALLHPGFDRAVPNPDYDLDLFTNEASRPWAEYVADRFSAYTSIALQSHQYSWIGADVASFWQYGFPAVDFTENTPEEFDAGANLAMHTAGDRYDNPAYDWDFGLEGARGALAALASAAVIVPEPSTLLLSTVFVFVVRRPRTRYA